MKHFSEEEFQEQKELRKMIDSVQSESISTIRKRGTNLTPKKKKRKK